MLFEFDEYNILIIGVSHKALLTSFTAIKVFNMSSCTFYYCFGILNVCFLKTAKRLPFCAVGQMSGCITTAIWLPFGSKLAGRDSIMLKLY